LPDHPQHHTHEVQRTCLSDLVVPNFIGGTLPRCDQGDREYYCSTMLALFKPWRTGNDLKVLMKPGKKLLMTIIFHLNK